jgi:hypothetical protein
MHIHSNFTPQFIPHARNKMKWKQSFPPKSATCSPLAPHTDKYKRWTTVHLLCIHVFPRRHSANHVPESHSRNQDRHIAWLAGWMKAKVYLTKLYQSCWNTRVRCIRLYTLRMRLRIPLAPFFLFPSLRLLLLVRSKIPLKARVIMQGRGGCGGLYTLNYGYYFHNSDRCMYMYMDIEQGYWHLYAGSRWICMVLGVYVQ